MTTVLWALFALLSACLLASKIESWLWNGGHCRKCGHSWEYFDTDSQGGRGYWCKNRHTVWVSWPGVDRRPR